MKTKIASWILLFFTFLPAFSAEVPSFQAAGGKADNIVRRTLDKLRHSWRGVKENLSFAFYSLRDKGVYSRREAEARARFTVKETREKAEEIVNDAKDQAGNTIEEAGEAIRKQYRSTEQKVGEKLP